MLHELCEELIIQDKVEIIINSSGIIIAETGPIALIFQTTLNCPRFNPPPVCRQEKGDEKSQLIPIDELWKDSTFHNFDTWSSLILQYWLQYNNPINLIIHLAQPGSMIVERNGNTVTYSISFAQGMLHFAEISGPDGWNRNFPAATGN